MSNGKMDYRCESVFFDLKTKTLIILLLNITKMTSNINLQDYYSKISEMRSKILSKHQNNQTNGPKIA